MVAACRNLGRPGVASMAVAAVDTALWDLKARLLELPLATTLDAAHGSVPIYGSGGFTSYPDCATRRAARGLGRAGDPAREDEGRPRARARPRARRRGACGDRCGRRALRRRQRRPLPQAGARASPRESAERFAVSWFEEPVSSDDLEGLRLIRDRGPEGMEVAAGEYGYMLGYFEAMLDRRRGRLPAGRRHALRGDHRLSACRGALPGALAAALGALRPVDPRPRVLRRRASAPPRVLPRPRPRSSGCSSTACSSPRQARCDPISPGPATGSSSSARTPRPTPPRRKR